MDLGLLSAMPGRGAHQKASDTYGGHVKVVNVLPGLGLGMGDVDFCVIERAAIPDVRQSRFCADAEAAVVPHEEGYSDGVEQWPCGKHADFAAMG